MDGEISPFSVPNKRASTIVPSTDRLVPNNYVSYRGVRETNGCLVANTLNIFPNTVTALERKYLRATTPQISEPDYKVRAPGVIRYKGGDTIEILPDVEIQNYLREIGHALIPAYQIALASSDPAKINFRFYVVRPFENKRNNQLVAIDGGRPALTYSGFFTPSSPLSIPANGTIVENVVEMPDGIVLVPDVLLSKLDSKAQLAFLLTEAITSIVQKQAYVTKYFEKYSDIGSPLDAYLQDQRSLRMSIRQMYLAGYDIREAPFAWAVAQGKPVNNPVIDSKDPDKDFPWFAAYAFNYIRQYYQNVDYSKLKRGRAEYQQFLKELYKTDPSLPHPKQSSASSATN